MLEARGITKSFGALQALGGVDIEIGPGEVVGLVGPNGSGKSTLLNILSGFDRCDAGSVRFEGEEMTGAAPWHVAERGMRRTFQLARQPQKMTALEVLLLGDTLPRGRRMRDSLLRPGRVAAEQAEAVGRARDMLDFLTLLPLEHHAAGSLSGGQQKLLALGAALIGRPKMMLLDEPTAGVNQSLRVTLADTLRRSVDDGMPLLVVEHDMEFVRHLCDRVYVLDRGAIIASCRPEELTQNRRVVEAYLGTALSEAPVAVAEAS